MSKQSKAACELSIQLLFRDAAWCYLWTYTFPDDVPPAEAARRWRLFVRWHLDTKRRCVRVIEVGSEAGRWHYHCVTPDRWDVNEVRAAAESRGFGRINVRRIPAKAAGYVAKYLNKQFRSPLPRGQRRWASVGFDGVAVKRVKATTRTRFLPKVWAGYAPTAVVWTLDGQEMSRFELRKVEPPGLEEILRVNLSAAEVDAIPWAMRRGPVSCGIYRGLRVTQKVVEDHESGARIERSFVDHIVLSGSDDRVLRQGITGEPDSVELPAKPGEIVIAIIETYRVFAGIEYFKGEVLRLADVAKSHAESLQAV